MTERCRTSSPPANHGPASTWPCAWVRIGYAILVLINAACWYPDLQRWFGRDGILAAETLTFLQSNYRWSVLTLLPGDDATLQVVFWLFVASAVCLLLGLASRVSAACVLVEFQNLGHECSLTVGLGGLRR